MVLVLSLEHFRTATGALFKPANNSFALCSVDKCLEMDRMLCKGSQRMASVSSDSLNHDRPDNTLSGDEPLFVITGHLLELREAKEYDTNHVRLST